MLVNEKNGNVLATEVRVAATFWPRFRGLMLEQELPRGAALHIEQCRCIHTFFMRFPIDVLYLDAHYRIVGAQEQMGPHRIGKPVRSAASVIELPAGILRETDTVVGQSISFIQKIMNKGVQ